MEKQKCKIEYVTDENTPYYKYICDMFEVRIDDNRVNDATSEYTNELVNLFESKKSEIYSYIARHLCKLNPAYVYMEVLESLCSPVITITALGFGYIDLIYDLGSLEPCKINMEFMGKFETLSYIKVKQ